jgi:hypothetical protein
MLRMTPRGQRHAHGDVETPISKDFFESSGGTAFLQDIQFRFLHHQSNEIFR